MCARGNEVFVLRQGAIERQEEAECQKAAQSLLPSWHSIVLLHKWCALSSECNAESKHFLSGGRSINFKVSTQSKHFTF